MEVKVQLGVCRANYFCKVLPAQLVTVFELTIVVSLLLNSIVSQVDELICNIV